MSAQEKHRKTKKLPPTSKVAAKPAFHYCKQLKNNIKGKNEKV
jgi:hypothetical protein